MGGDRGSGGSGALSGPVPHGIEQHGSAHVVSLTSARAIRALLALATAASILGVGLVVLVQAWFLLSCAGLLAVGSVVLVFKPSRLVLDDAGIRYDTVVPSGAFAIAWDDLRDVRDGVYAVELVRAEGLPARLPIWGLDPEVKQWLLARIRARVESRGLVDRLPGVRSADGVEVSTGASPTARTVAIVLRAVFVAIGLSVAAPLLFSFPTTALAWFAGGVALLALGGWFVASARQTLRRPDSIRLGARDLILLQSRTPTRRIPLFEVDSATWQLVRRRLRIRLVSGETLRIPLSPDAVTAVDAEHVARAIDAAARSARSDPTNTESIDPRLAELARKARQSDS